MTGFLRKIFVGGRADRWQGQWCRSDAGPTKGRAAGRSPAHPRLAASLRGMQPSSTPHAELEDAALEFLYSIILFHLPLNSKLLRSSGSWFCHLLCSCVPSMWVPISKLVRFLFSRSDRQKQRWTRQRPGRSLLVQYETAHLEGTTELFRYSHVSCESTAISY